MDLFTSALTFLACKSFVLRGSYSCLLSFTCLRLLLLSALTADKDRKNEVEQHSGRNLTGNLLEKGSYCILVFANVLLWYCLLSTSP